MMFLIPALAFGQTSQIDTDGWEFLKWGLDSDEVEAELKARNIAFTPLQPMHKLPSTSFEYNGFDVRLHYDDGLYDVQQKKSWQLLQKAEADDFFQKLIKELTEKNGEPESRKRDEHSAKEELSWKGSRTTIDLVYWSGSEPQILLQFGPNNP